jgi:hypothetical protein
MTGTGLMKFTGCVALATTSFLGSTTSAVAANVDGCGLEPDGASLDNNGGVCELTFDTAGSFTWTLPAGIAGLHGILVGGGSGANYNSPDTGYAGAGGSVEYVDLTDTAPTDVLSIEVGAGGNTDGTFVLTISERIAEFPGTTAGGATTVAVNSDLPYSAAGGTLNGWWAFCSPGFRDGFYWGEGPGATVVLSPPQGMPCNGGGAGIVPDTDPSAPSAFDGFTTELGHGGGVLVDTSRALGMGDGANVYLNSIADSDSADPDGADGGVIFRYSASAANNDAESSGSDGSGTGTTGSLADTGIGVPVAALTLAAVGVIAAGVAATTVSRRQTLRRE